MLVTHPGYVDAELLGISSFHLIRARDHELVTSPRAMKLLSDPGVEVLSHTAAGIGLTEGARSDGQAARDTCGRGWTKSTGPTWTGWVKTTGGGRLAHHGPRGLSVTTVPSGLDLARQPGCSFT